MEKPYRILVVDSEPNFIETAKRAFEGSFEVTYASNEKEGLEKARNEAFDIIVLGYLEPRGTAFELNRKLREEPMTRNISLLVVDVRPEEHSRKGWRRDEGLKMDAEGYVSRPIEPGELKETVERILHRAEAKPLDLSEVLEQMEGMLKRMDKIEKQLVK